MAIPEPNNKCELRAVLRRRLREAEENSAPVTEAVRRRLADRPELRTVAMFAALPGEVDLLPLLAWDPTRCWVLPRIDGAELRFHQVLDPARDFVSGPLGIREPAASLPLVPVEVVDVFLCPGLAFDVRGGRLGRGRGFYDRMLAAARPGALKIGICRPFQRVPDTFAEPHDVPMDEVISA